MLKQVLLQMSEMVGNRNNDVCTIVHVLSNLVCQVWQLLWKSLHEFFLEFFFIIIIQTPSESFRARSNKRVPVFYSIVCLPRNIRCKLSKQGTIKSKVYFKPFTEKNWLTERYYRVYVYDLIVYEPLLYFCRKTYSAQDPFLVLSCATICKN